MKRITDLSDNQPSDGVTQTHKYIEFDYDAMEEQAQLVMASSPPGRKEWSDERIAKHTYKPDFGLVKSTYYILDAQGNPISTYFHENKEEGITYQLGEKMIYGSSRLGMKQDALSMLQTTSSPLGSSRKDSALVGLKSYELSNHLGNVLTLFRDVLNGDATNGYWVDVASVSDYSPFGVQLDGRTQGNQGRFGFQGQESDDEIKGNGNSVNYKYRMHDPRVGRFFAVDPLADKYPHYSTYGFSGNHVINSVELEGLEDVRVYDQQNDGTFKYIKTYTNNELQTDVNRYNYKVNNVISDVVFKNEGLRIKYDKVSQIDGKAYAETFNSLIPKPVQETPSPSEGVNYKTQMKNDAWNKGDYSRYFRYLGNQLDQECEGEKG
ncbi:MAG: hypothetical protein KJ941_08430 [Bacteroidetes bacterium]|nr:hypothetical protein [Bacteroidota bacterium]